MADGRAVPDASSYGEAIETRTGLSRANLGRDRNYTGDEIPLLNLQRVRDQTNLRSALGLPYVDLDTTTIP